MSTISTETFLTAWRPLGDEGERVRFRRWYSQYYGQNGNLPRYAAVTGIVNHGTGAIIAVSMAWQWSQWSYGSVEVASAEVGQVARVECRRLLVIRAVVQQEGCSCPTASSCSSIVLPLSGGAMAGRASAKPTFIKSWSWQGGCLETSLG
jgi:hypothetical protein